MKLTALPPNLRAEARRRALAALAPHQRGPAGAAVSLKSDALEEPLADAEFQGKVLGLLSTQETKLKEFRTQAEEMSQKVSDMPKQLKGALEEIEKLQKTANDSATDREALEKKFGDFNRVLRENVHREFGSPLDRLLASEDKRDWINAAFRKVAFPTHKLGDRHEAVLKAFTGVDSSLGQATIPTEWLPEIYSLLSSYGIFNTFGLITNISARTATIPLATARPTYYWIGGGTGGTTEGSAITEGSFTGTSVNLTIQTLTAFIGVARELIQDSSADIAAYVTAGLFQSIAYGLDFAALAADATADQTDAGYRGVFDAAALNTLLKAEAAAGNVSVETTDLEDWERCRTTVNAPVLNMNPRWWMHPYILSKAGMIKDGQGRPIFQTALEAPAPGAIGRILGAPVILGDACPSTNAASAKIAVFGDPMGQAVGIRQDFELATSDQFRFTSNQICYRALTRAGVQLKSATASTTLKPFAVLTLPAA